MISVFVAVTVAVAAGGGAAGTVEDHSQVLEFAFLVDRLQLREHRALQQAGAHHEEGAVAVAFDDLGVGHDLYGRAVDDDEVIIIFKFTDGLLEARVGHEFRRVGRDGADRQGEERRGVLALLDDAVQVVCAVGQVVGEADLGRTHILRLAGVAQVAVDDEHALVADGERHGEVHRDEGLAGAGIEGRDGEDAVLLALGHEFEVGAQHAESFVDDVAVAFLHHDRVRVDGLLVQDPAETAGDVVAVVAVEGDLAQEGQGQFLEVVASAHGGVETLDQADDEGRQEEADQQGQDEGRAAGRRDGEHRAGGRVDDAGVVGREGLAELVLLAFLQEEEVEGFLDGLLPLHAEQVLGLGRVGGDAGGVAARAALQVGDLLFERGHEVVHGADDVGAHPVEGVVGVDDERVGRAGIRQQLVALEDLGVVGGDLRLEARAVDARIGGQQTAGIVVGGQVVADVAGHRQLVGQLLLLRVQGAVLAHIEARGGVDVGHELFALVGGDVAVHAGQLVLDHGEALVDEDRGAVGDLVLVFDPVLVIDGDQGVEDVLGALDVGVLQGEGDDVGAVAGVVADGQALAEVRGRGLDAAARDVEELGEVAVVGGRGEDADGAGGCGDSLAEQAFGRGALDLLAVEDEVGERELGDAVGADGEADGFVLAEGVGGDADRERAGVEEHAMAGAVDAAAGLEVEPADDFQHIGGGGEGADFVGDLGVGAHEPEVGEVEVGGGAALGVGLDQDLGTALIKGHAAVQVEGCGRDDDDDGDDEPVPVGEAQEEELLEFEEFGVALGLLEIGGLVGDIVLRGRHTSGGSKGRWWRPAKLR